MLAAVEWALRPDGFLHLMQGGHDLPRGPLGLLLYLPLVPLYWLVPPARRPLYLTLTSLLLAVVTLGPAYTATVLALVLLALVLVRTCATHRRLPAGITLLASVYAALLLVPQPPWLAHVEHPLYFYLHWAGIGYIFLKTVHVLVEVAGDKLPPPASADFLVYLLFPATLRMGPIYRFGDFHHQLHRDARAHRDLGAAAIRIAAGCVRLGLMAALLGRLPIETLFDHPETLSAGELALRLYAAPISIYLWISGYVDFSVAIGLMLGFNVPENFLYPWGATSLGDFWRRWHITLGAWLRDYLYIPLGGNRRHVFLNYLVTFAFCGLWHGLYTSYFLWGLSQGVGLAVARRWRLFWARQAEANSPLYRRLDRLYLVRSPLSITLAWLLTFNYQILTIAWFMDEHHAGRLVARRVLDLL